MDSRRYQLGEWCTAYDEIGVIFGYKITVETPGASTIFI